MDYVLTLEQKKITASLERTVYRYGRLEIKEDLEDTDFGASLLLAKSLAFHGVGEGIRHSIVMFSRCKNDDGGKPDVVDGLVVDDLDDLAFIFSQDRNMTLFRHCLDHAFRLTGFKLLMESEENYALARGLFLFVRPYYRFYLLDNIQRHSVDFNKVKDYVDIMMSDAEMRCFARSPMPRVTSTFCLR